MSRLLVNFPVGTQPSSHLPLAHLHSHLHRRSHPPAMMFVCRHAGRHDEWEMRSTKVRKIQQIFEHLKESTMESMALCLHWPLGKKVPRSSISCEEFHRDRAVISHAPHESWTVLKPSSMQWHPRTICLLLQSKRGAFRISDNPKTQPTFSLIPDLTHHVIRYAPTQFI